MYIALTCYNLLFIAPTLIGDEVLRIFFDIPNEPIMRYVYGWLMPVFEYVSHRPISESVWTELFSSFALPMVLVLSVLLWCVLISWGAYRLIVKPLAHSIEH